MSQPGIIPGFSVSGGVLTTSTGQQVPVTVGGFNSDGTAYYVGSNGTVYGKQSLQPTLPDLSPGQAAGAGIPSTGNNAYTPPSTGLWGFIAGVDRNIPFLGSLDSALNINPNDSGSLTASNGPIATTASGIGTLLSIVTDLPRLVTIIVGIILLIAGLFMLGVGPAVQVVGALKDKIPPVE